MSHAFSSAGMDGRGPGKTNCVKGEEDFSVLRGGGSIQAPMRPIGDSILIECPTCMCHFYFSLFFFFMYSGGPKILSIGTSVSFPFFSQEITKTQDFFKWAGGKQRKKSNNETDYGVEWPMTRFDSNDWSVGWLADRLTDWFQRTVNGAIIATAVRSERLRLFSH